jgi:hypothetical protein
MHVYHVPNIKDPRALLSYILMREPIEERLARDRKRYIGSIENRSLLLVFFCLWARHPVFRGLSKEF